MQALENFKKTLKITTVNLLKLEKSPHYNRLSQKRSGTCIPIIFKEVSSIETRTRQLERKSYSGY